MLDQYKTALCLFLLKFNLVKIKKNRADFNNPCFTILVYNAGAYGPGQLTKMFLCRFEAKRPLFACRFLKLFSVTA